MDIFEDKSVLITGGTGSFGKAMVKRLLSLDIKPKKIIIFSRDEYKQNQMIKEFGQFPGGKLRFFVGDVRDQGRLMVALRGVDYVFHAAALKQIPSCEYNPWEAVKTNIIGSQNLIASSIVNRVNKVIMLSTDKAVNPVTLYGGTKLVAEKLFIQANILGRKKTFFSVVRYGNVLASRGSVVNEFKRQAERNFIQITDKRMTRFWWKIDSAVQFVLYALNDMVGGEIFIPKIKSSFIVDLAHAVCPDCKIIESGVRPGEKISELLIAPDEISRTYESLDYYFIVPQDDFFTFEWLKGGSTKVDSDLNYSSDSVDFMMENPVETLREMIGKGDCVLDGTDKEKD